MHRKKEPRDGASGGAQARPAGGPAGTRRPARGGEPPPTWSSLPSGSWAADEASRVWEHGGELTADRGLCCCRPPCPIYARRRPWRPAHRAAAVTCGRRLRRPRPRPPPHLGDESTKTCSEQSAELHTGPGAARGALGRRQPLSPLLPPFASRPGKAHGVSLSSPPGSQLRSGAPPASRPTPGAQSPRPP